MKKSSSDKPATGMSANGTPFPNDRDRFILRETLTSKNQEFIQSLVTAAKEGDEDYAYALYHLAWFATMNLQVEVDRNRELARKIGPFVDSWPMMVSNSPNYLSGIPNFIESIALGSKSNSSLDAKKTGRQHTKARELALELIFLIDGVRKASDFLHAAMHSAELLSTVRDDHGLNKDADTHRVEMRFFRQEARNMFMQCKGALRGLGTTLGIRGMENVKFGIWQQQALMLPSLNRGTVPLWIKLGMEVISDLTGHHLEDNPFLFELGRYKLEHFYRKEAKRRLSRKKIDDEVKALAKELEAEGSANKTAVGFLYEGITTRLVEACEKMAPAEGSESEKAGS